MKRLHIIVPMAGEGKRFKDSGYNEAKPLIKIDGTTIFEKALSSFSSLNYENTQYTFIVRKEFIESNIENVIHNKFKNANIVYVDKTTNGSLETVYLSKYYINDNDAVLLMDCDIYFNSSSFLQKIKNKLKENICTPVLLTFDSNDAKYSYVKVNDDGYAIKVVEKNPISNNAIIGCYFAGEGQLFKKTSKQLIDKWYNNQLDSKEIYTSLLFNEYTKITNVEVHKLNKGECFISMGTPEEFDIAKEKFENKVYKTKGCPNKLVVDLDDTLSYTINGDYKNSKPIVPVIDMLKQYKEKGFQIVIHTSRQMRTYNGQIGQINIYTLPNIIEWLDKNDVTYDEIIVGKPWCGFDGWYIDDKAIRPSEFLNLSQEEIENLLAKEKTYNRSLAK